MTPTEQLRKRFRGTIHVTVSENIKLEDLQKALARIVGEAGCTACGLVGFDFHFTPGDPAPFESLRKVPGVTGITVSER